MTGANTDNTGDPYRSRLQAALAGRYEIQEEIGRGGMGIVFRAVDRGLRRTVALKLLPPEMGFRPEIRERFLREAVSAGQLSHPNIVPIHAVDEIDGLVYFAMGFVDGANLGDIISREGALSHTRARKLLTEIAEALAYAHSRGVVHRDIKPDNIIVEHVGGRAIVTDFGIARAAIGADDTRLTATGVAIGTPAYMSPEQCVGDAEVDGRSDLYSLGIVAYQMLTGAVPFSAPSTPAMLIKQFSEQPQHISERRSDVPEELANIVMWLLVKEPAGRPADGGELLRALRGNIAPVTTSAASAAKRPSAATAAGMGAGTGGRDAARVAKRSFSARPLAERVRILRADIMRTGATSLMLVTVNVVTSPDFPWSLFAIIGLGMGLTKKVSNVTSDGVRLRDLFGRNARALLAGGKPAVGAPPARRDVAEQFASAELLNSAYGPAIRNAIRNHTGIEAQMEQLSPADRSMIIDAAPVSRALLEKMVATAGTLEQLDRDVDAARISGLDERILLAEQEVSAGTAPQQKLALLTKQRSALADLAASRRALYSQFEGAALMLENLSLDLLKLRSAGMQSVMNDVNNATTEARALLGEIGNVIQASDELRTMDMKSGEKRE